MKTIELPDELADTLISIGKELAVQDNLATAWPVWYVTEEKRVITSESYGDYKARKDSDYIDPDEQLCPECLGLWGLNELPNDCDNWECEDSFYWYNVEREYASHGSCFFLTQKACQGYIDENAYHFNSPQPYAGSAHRNHEIQPIVEALIIAAGCEVPTNHYRRSA